MATDVLTPGVATAVTATGTATLNKPKTDTLTQVQFKGTYNTVVTFKGSFDGTNFFPVVAKLKSTGASINGNVANSVTSDVKLYEIPSAGLSAVQVSIDTYTSGTQFITAQSGSYVGLPSEGNQTSGNTFSGATFNGTASAFSVMPTIPSTTVAATGSVQGDAAAIATGFTLVSGADDTKGVVLPAAAAGLVCLVKSSVSNKILKVYPASGDAINALSANAAISLASGPTPAIFVAYDATTWYTIPLLPC